MKASLLAVCLVAACGPETTSFRATDHGDGTDRGGPGAAAYDLRLAETSASVHVWTNGGYMSSTEEPMTHVGFALHNAGTSAFAFDTDGLTLVPFDKHGRPLPPATFVTVAPLGPSVVPVPAGETVELDAYFRMSIRPRVVDHMQVHWLLRSGDSRREEITSFVRSDGYPVIEPAPRLESAGPGA